MQVSKNYLVYDGILRDSTLPVFRSHNRGFRYGDGLFETLRYHKGKPLFFDLHYNRLLQGMTVMKFDLRSFPSRTELERSICDLVVKNRIFYDARIRLSVFRQGEGFYTPLSNRASWIIEASSLGESGYQFPGKGLLVDIYTGFPRQVSPLSPFKTSASYPSVLAGVYRNEKGLDDCLLVNNNGRIVESISANLFWVKDNIIYTPLVSCGCIEGVFRSKIFELADKYDFKIIECSGATESDLLDADEIFLTNVITGVKWVSAFGQRRYYSTMGKLIQQAINHTIMLKE